MQLYKNNFLKLVQYFIQKSIYENFSNCFSCLKPNLDFWKKLTVFKIFFVNLPKILSQSIL